MTVTGPPFSICFLNTGITDPREPSTLPKRTAANLVWDETLSIPVTSISAIRFEAPITLGGLLALSVDTITKTSTLAFFAAVATFNVPKTLFFTASVGLASINGTCLWAAAW